MRIFGSVARDQANEDSDVDLIADFRQPERLTLFTLGRAPSRLCGNLGISVDLSQETTLRPYLRERALKEAFQSF